MNNKASSTGELVNGLFDGLGFLDRDDFVAPKTHNVVVVIKKNLTEFNLRLPADTNAPNDAEFFVKIDDSIYRHTVDGSFGA